MPSTKNVTVCLLATVTTGFSELEQPEVQPSAIAIAEDRAIADDDRPLILDRFINAPKVNL